MRLVELSDIAENHKLHARCITPRAPAPMLIYLHGFNSSPASFKANLLHEKLQNLGRGDLFHCPTLSHAPREAMRGLEESISGYDPRQLTLVGSSLGGFYATGLAERHGCKAVLVNPAITPHTSLRAYLGSQRNLYTGAAYELTEQHLRELADLFIARIARPENYLLLVTTGDEVLDYHDAVAKYAGAQQVVVEGGDHAFRDFGVYLDKILAFSGIAAR
jgi:uncharacterized protein